MSDSNQNQPMSGQPGQPAEVLTDDRVKTGGVGAHLGESVDRGLTGGRGLGVKAVVGDNVPTEGAGDASGGDLGLEGATRAGLAVQNEEERSPDYPRRPDASEGSDSPRVLGMGAGDPGYTAEEDDEGTGELPSKV